MNESRIRVLLADDHLRFRAELAGLIEDDHQLTVIGEASDGRRAVELARQLFPDVVVMDVQMPTMNGIEATRQIKALCPEVAVIGLSSSDHAPAMLQAGVSTYSLKQDAVEDLCGAIRRDGERVMREKWADSEKLFSSLLIIDDDPVFLKTVFEALRDQHPNVTIATATSAEHGLRLHTLRQFDGIISDFRMAGLNGMDFLKECHARCPYTPVVLITGYETVALEQDALDQGACAILQKPVDLNRLYDVVMRARCRTKWLERGETRQAHDFAQRRQELSARIQKVGQRLNDVLKANE